MKVQQANEKRERKTVLPIWCLLNGFLISPQRNYLKIRLFLVPNPCIHLKFRFWIDRSLRLLVWAARLEFLDFRKMQIGLWLLGLETLAIASIEGNLLQNSTCHWYGCDSSLHIELLELPIWKTIGRETIIARNFRLDSIRTPDSGENRQERTLLEGTLTESNQ